MIAYDDSRDENVLRYRIQMNQKIALNLILFVIMSALIGRNIESLKRTLDLYPQIVYWAFFNTLIYFTSVVFYVAARYKMSSLNIKKIQKMSFGIGAIIFFFTMWGSMVYY